MYFSTYIFTSSLVLPRCVFKKLFLIISFLLLYYTALPHVLYIFIFLFFSFHLFTYDFIIVVIISIIIGNVHVLFLNLVYFTFIYFFTQQVAVDATGFCLRHKDGRFLSGAVTEPVSKGHME